MKSIKHILMPVLAAGLFCSCLAQPSVRIDCNQYPANKSYDMTGFNALNVSNAFEVDMFPSDRESVQLTVPAGAEPYVVVEKRGNTLYIGMKDGHSYNFTRGKDDHCLKAYVYFKDLTAVKGSGAAEIDIKGTYDARNGNLTIDLSGASSFDGRVLNLAKLKAELSGASELDMKGSATDVELTASGASDADLEELFVRNFSGHVSGASKAELNVSETFSGSASGASKIEVKGRPRVLKADDSGASTIRFE
ncbi:MAG: DUF2807 domain-containing protein [Bacteroides sp.]|nr:DUF2807 domain-containing protein [Bacteroides sp.]